MKMNVKKMLAVVAFALPVLLVACTKDNVEPPINGVTSVKLSFTDTEASPKLPGQGSTVDLSKAATVKIEYTVNDGSNQTQQIREVVLNLAGDRSKVSTIDHHRIFTFNGGSTMTIHSATILDSNGGFIATAPADQFKVVSPGGNPIMERSYEAIGRER